MNEPSLKDKVAIVTGASRGIGRAIALALAAKGARVVLAARTITDLGKVAAEIDQAGGTAVAIPTDVTAEKGAALLVRKTVDTFGRLDILVNNAGSGSFGPLEKTSVEAWDTLMAVNARGPFLLCRESIPHLRQQPLSFIINITSVVGNKGYANQSAYSASKHAAMGLTKALAKEVQKDGIRVHAICPGGVDTEMATASRPDLDRSELMQPEDIADVVLFLVTRRGKAVIDQVDMRRASAIPWA